MSKYKIAKTHLALLEDAAYNSSGSVEINVQEFKKSVYLEVKEIGGDELIISNAWWDSNDYTPNSSLELVSEVLSGLMFWALRGTQNLNEEQKQRESENERFGRFTVTVEDSTAHL